MLEVSFFFFVFHLSASSFFLKYSKKLANKHSEPHDEHDEWDKKNWAFTFDEQGKYDVPNTIDYIRSVSGQNKVAVVGHSQGCAQLFSALHQHPTLHEKLSFFGALAPAGFFKHNVKQLLLFFSFFFFFKKSLTKIIIIILD